MNILLSKFSKVVGGVGGKKSKHKIVVYLVHHLEMVLSAGKAFSNSDLRNL